MSTKKRQTKYQQHDSESDSEVIKYQKNKQIIREDSSDSGESDQFSKKNLKGKKNKNIKPYSIEGESEEEEEEELENVKKRNGNERKGRKPTRELDEEEGRGMKKKHKREEYSDDDEELEVRKKNKRMINEKYEKRNKRPRLYDDDEEEEDDDEEEEADDYSDDDEVEYSRPKISRNKYQKFKPTKHQRSKETAGASKSFKDFSKFAKPKTKVGKELDLDSKTVDKFTRFIEIPFNFTLECIEKILEFSYKDGYINQKDYNKLCLELLSISSQHNGVLNEKFENLDVLKENFSKKYALALEEQESKTHETIGEENEEDEKTVDDSADASDDEEKNGSDENDEEGSDKKKELENDSVETIETDEKEIVKKKKTVKAPVFDFSKPYQVLLDEFLCEIYFKYQSLFRENYDTKVFPFVQPLDEEIEDPMNHVTFSAQSILGKLMQTIYSSWSEDENLERKNPDEYKIRRLNNKIICPVEEVSIDLKGKDDFFERSTTVDDRLAVSTSIPKHSHVNMLLGVEIFFKEPFINFFTEKNSEDYILSCFKPYIPFMRTKLYRIPESGGHHPLNDDCSNMVASGTMTSRSNGLNTMLNIVLNRKGGVSLEDTSKFNSYHLGKKIYVSGNILNVKFVRHGDDITRYVTVNIMPHIVVYKEEEEGKKLEKTEKAGTSKFKKNQPMNEKKNTQKSKKNFRK